MASSEKLLNEFIDAWNAGERPRVGDYLDRAPERERGELAGLINAFLEEAPTPAYSAATLEEIRREPATQRAAALLADGGWHALLPRLRNRARMKREEVVKLLAERLGVGAAEPKVAIYYHQMESGTLDPSGVSRRVLEALSGIFRVNLREIEKAGDFPLPTVALEALYLRTTEEIDALARADQAAGPPAGPEAPEMDEVDRLFRGGR